jgi:hypothetical protein
MREKNVQKKGDKLDISLSSTVEMASDDEQPFKLWSLEGKMGQFVGEVYVPITKCNRDIAAGGAGDQRPQAHTTMARREN